MRLSRGPIRATGSILTAWQSLHNRQRWPDAPPCTVSPRQGYPHVRSLRFIGMGCVQTASEIGRTAWSCHPLGIAPVDRTEPRRTSVFTLGEDVVSYTGAGI